MSNKWEDKGEKATLFDSIVDTVTLDNNPFPKEHWVENEETGDTRVVMVNPDQTVGEAIEKGQFKTDD